LKVSEVEEEVLKAEAKMRTVKLASITARVGNSAIEPFGKWEASDVDKDAESIEFGKARYYALSMIGILVRICLQTNIFMN